MKFCTHVLLCLSEVQRPDVPDLVVQVLDLHPHHVFLPPELDCAPAEVFALHHGSDFLLRKRLIARDDIKLSKSH